MKEPSPDRKGAGAMCPELIHPQIRGTQRLCPVWRGSPDLPCRYSYRHLEFNSRMAVQAPSIDKSVDAADVGVRATSPLKLPLPEAKNTENRLISFHSVSPSRHKAPGESGQTRAATGHASDGCGAAMPTGCGFTPRVRSGLGFVRGAAP